jgi:single-strand DNA-binding protein
LIDNIYFWQITLIQDNMSVNKVILIGNVGKDPEVRYLDSGVAVATVVLATSDRAYTLQNGTQVPERTEWHNLVLWRGLAETAETYVHKGDKLYIEGKIRTRSYDDQNGVKRYTTEIQVDTMEMLTPRGNGAQQPSAQPTPQYIQPQQPAAQPAPQQPASSPADDLPF